MTISTNRKSRLKITADIDYSVTVSGLNVGGSLVFAQGTTLLTVTTDGTYLFTSDDSTKTLAITSAGLSGAVSVDLAALDNASAGGSVSVVSSVLPSGAASEAKQDTAITAINRSGTREYNIAGISRQAVGAASARVALPTLGASREVYVMASTRCFFLAGNSSVVAAAGTSHPLAADERFHLRIPATATHIAYIRDTADGVISIVPTAV